MTGVRSSEDDSSHLLALRTDAAFREAKDVRGGTHSTNRGFSSFYADILGEEGWGTRTRRLETSVCVFVWLYIYNTHMHLHTRTHTHRNTRTHLYVGLALLLSNCWVGSTCVPISSRK
jgi:hypothetical protein